MLDNILIRFNILQERIVYRNDYCYKNVLKFCGIFGIVLENICTLTNIDL